MEAQAVVKGAQVSTVVNGGYRAVIEVWCHRGVRVGVREWMKCS